MYNAIINGDLEEVKRLLTLENIEFKDNSGWTLLHYATYYTQLEIVQLRILGLLKGPQ